MKVYTIAFSIILLALNVSVSAMMLDEQEIKDLKNLIIKNNYGELYNRLQLDSNYKMRFNNLSNATKTNLLELAKANELTLEAHVVRKRSYHYVIKNIGLLAIAGFTICAGSRYFYNCLAPDNENNEVVQAKCEDNDIQKLALAGMTFSVTLLRNIFKPTMTAKHTEARSITLLLQKKLEQ